MSLQLPPMTRRPAHLAQQRRARAAAACEAAHEAHKERERLALRQIRQGIDPRRVVASPDDQWSCRCRYRNIGSVCTHCGRPRPA